MIVVGILLALGADAAWESRQAAIREQVHLNALAGDFRQLRINASLRINDLDGWIQDLKDLVEARADGDVPQGLLDQWLAGGLIEIRQFEPPIPTVDDLKVVMASADKLLAVVEKEVEQNQD